MDTDGHKEPARLGCMILQAAAKKGGEAKVRDAKCAVDGETPLDLAKQRLQKTPETEEYLDERKKIEKTIRHIETIQSSTTMPAV